MTNLGNRLAELDILLNYVDSEDWAKIPDDIIFYIKENKNEDYEWQYDESKSLEEQDLSRDTFSLLTYIMYTYVATDEERQQLDEIIEENTKSLEEKYDPSKIFGDASQKAVSHHDEEELEKIEASLIESEKEQKSLFTKIVEFFKKLFK